MKCPLGLCLVDESNERIAGVGGKVSRTGDHDQADQREEANLGDEGDRIGADVVAVLVDDEEAAAANEHVRAGEQVKCHGNGKVSYGSLKSFVEAEETCLQQRQLQLVQVVCCVEEEGKVKLQSLTLTRSLVLFIFQSITTHLS